MAGSGPALVRAFHFLGTKFENAPFLASHIEEREPSPIRSMRQVWLAAQRRRVAESPSSIFDRHNNAVLQRRRVHAPSRDEHEVAHGVLCRTPGLDLVLSRRVALRRSEPRARRRRMTRSTLLGSSGRCCRQLVLVLYEEQLGQISSAHALHRMDVQNGTGSLLSCTPHRLASLVYPWTAAIVFPAFLCRSDRLQSSWRDPAA